jgi:hypothetical protein
MSVAAMLIVQQPVEMAKVFLRELLDEPPG